MFRNFDKSAADEGKSADHRQDGVRKPADRGKSTDASKPDDAGKPDSAGKSADTFGSKVSDAAKKLKDDSVDQRKQFGKWVSGQRRKDADHRADASTAGAANGKGPRASRRPRERRETHTSRRIDSSAIFCSRNLM